MKIKLVSCLLIILVYEKSAQCPYLPQKCIKFIQFLRLENLRKSPS